MESVAANHVGAGIGPAYVGWLQDGNPVQEEALFCLV
jgi:hypothetical protein